MQDDERKFMVEDCCALGCKTVINNVLVPITHVWVSLHGRTPIPTPTTEPAWPVDRGHK